MGETNGVLETVAVGLAGATVVGAVLLAGYLAVGVESGEPGRAIALGVGVLLLAVSVGLGAWKRRPRLAWLATLVLLPLGVVGIAVGPQILGIGALALLTSAVLSASVHLERRRKNPSLD